MEKNRNSISPELRFALRRDTRRQWSDTGARPAEDGQEEEQAEVPPLPSGPTGQPLRPMPLDAIATIPPQVTYENNQLTINAPNSTLAEFFARCES